MRHEMKHVKGWCRKVYDLRLLGYVTLASGSGARGVAAKATAPMMGQRGLHAHERLRLDR